MAFAAARMILKDKRRKPSKEDYTPRNKSKARNKPVDGHVPQKLQGGQRTPTHGPNNKNVPQKSQKGQPVKSGSTGANKTTKKSKKGKHHQHDLIVTINLVIFLGMIV